MIITYDPPKRLQNIEKHGLDFANLDAEFFLEALVVSGNTDRLKAIGKFQDGVIVVIFATLGTEGLSVISMRPANRRERKLYEQSIQTHQAVER